MKQPAIFHVDYLSEYKEFRRSKDGLWYKVRPKADKSFLKRLKASLLVLTGKADAVIWTEE